MQEERSEAPGAAPKLSPVFFRELKEGFTDAGDGFSPHFISAAENQATPENQEEGDEDDFEFAFFVDDRSNHEPDDDEVQSPPIFPVFNRDVLSSSTTASDEEVLKPVLGPLQRLMIEEREACSRSGSTSSSSSTEELEADVPGVYCVWRRKAPESCKIKSRSTGTSSLGGRIRDLVVGRSHSEGKQKYIYLVPEEKSASTQPDHPAASPSREAAPPKVKAAAGEKGKGKGRGKGAKGKERRLTEMDMVTAHRLLYGKGGEASAGAGGVGGRRSFLPYRRNFLGFFGDVNTHGRPL